MDPSYLTEPIVLMAYVVVAVLVAAIAGAVFLLSRVDEEQPCCHIPTGATHFPITSARLPLGRTLVECSCGGSWWFGIAPWDPPVQVAARAHREIGTGLGVPDAIFRARFSGGPKWLPISVDAQWTVRSDDVAVAERDGDTDSNRDHRPPPRRRSRR